MQYTNAGLWVKRSVLWHHDIFV